MRIGIVEAQATIVRTVVVTESGVGTKFGGEGHEKSILVKFNSRRKNRQREERRRREEVPKARKRNLSKEFPGAPLSQVIL